MTEDANIHQEYRPQVICMAASWSTPQYLFMFNVAPSDALLNFRYFLYDAYKRLTGKDKVKRNE